MDDFTYAVLHHGACLVEGSLNGPAPARLWCEDGWLTLNTTLSALSEYEVVTAISDEEAMTFLRGCGES